MEKNEKNEKNENTQNENENTQNENTQKIVIAKIDELNKMIEKAKTGKCWYYEKISEKSKSLHFSKDSLKALNENGVNYDKTYVSYNSTPKIYTAFLEIFENNDIFEKREVE